MIKTKTLAIVTPYFAANSGGVERYVYQIATRLNKNYEWKIIVITTGEKKGSDEISKEGGFTVYRLSYDYKLSNTPFSFKWFGKLRKIFMDEKPDIINVQTPVPGIGNVAAAVAGNTPVVVTYHAGSMKKGKILVDIPIWLYEHFFMHLLLRRANKIIFASSFVRNTFLKSYKADNPIVTPGTDTDLFKPNTKLKNKRPSMLIVVGQLTYAEQYKGLQTLIEVTKELKNKIPNILLTVIGDGEMRAEYEKRVNKLGLTANVIFKGRLGGKDLVDQYQKAHVLVSPSTNDNIPTVIIEAMSCGIPVVAYKVGAVGTLVDNNETGYVVKTKDSKALTQKIYELLSNPTKSLKLGIKGREKALANFDWQAKAQESNLVFTKLLKSSAKRLRVVHVVGYYPPHLGGMEIVAREVARELAKDCEMVKVITSNIGAKDASNFERKGNFEVHRLNSIEFAHTPVMWGLPLKLITLPKQSIIHVHCAQALTPEIALVIAKIRKFGYVAHFHLDVEPSGALGSLFLLYKKYVLGAVLRAADKVIVFSELQKKLVQDKYHVASSHIAIIPNGVGEEFYFNKKRITPKYKFNLLYVGRLTLQKRVDRIVEALAIVKSPVHLSIVGDGEDKEKLEMLADKLSLKNISFMGRKNGKDLISLYRKADAFVIPSDKEGMPLVVLEAMASGLPIIASDVIGLHELVSGVGVLVSRPSAKTFAAAIDKLWKEKMALKKLSNQSLREATQYSWDKVTDKIKLIYENL